MGAVQPEAGQLQGLRVEIPQTYWSCVSVVNVFHSEDFFLYVLVIIVRHLLLVHLQEEPGSFFINLLSGSGRQQPNSSSSFSPPDRTAPVLSASLPNRMDGLRLGPPPPDASKTCYVSYVPHTHNCQRGLLLQLK